MGCCIIIVFTNDNNCSHNHRFLYQVSYNHAIRWSLEDQVAGQVELHGRDHTGDELQEDQQGEVSLNLLPALAHGIRHGLEHVGVLAGVHRRHADVLHVLEFLDGEGLVQVLLLDVLPDVLVADGQALEVGGAEVHSGRVVVLVVDDVHGVVPNVLLLEVLLLLLGRV